MIRREAHMGDLFRFLFFDVWYMYIQQSGQQTHLYECIMIVRDDGHVMICVFIAHVLEPVVKLLHVILSCIYVHLSHPLHQSRANI